MLHLEERVTHDENFSFFLKKGICHTTNTSLIFKVIFCMFSLKFLGGQSIFKTKVKTKTNRSVFPTFSSLYNLGTSNAVTPMLGEVFCLSSYSQDKVGKVALN